MRRTSRLVLLLGVFLAAVTFIVIITGVIPSGGPGGSSATPPPTTADTVIATVDIPLGTVVTKEMVEKQVLSLTARDKGALADPSQAIGKTARVQITAGAQVVASAFSSQAQTTVSVPVGKRAFPIKVSALTGVGNLVSVGDSVDILISLTGTAFPTVQVLADGTVTVIAGLNPLSVKMPLLLQDVQIIQSIDQVVAPTAEGQAAASQAPVVTGKLLILAVTPAQAEVLLFVRDLNPENLPAIGSVELDLVLRSPVDTGVTVATDGVILKTLIDKYGVLPPQLIQAVLPKP